MLKVQNLTLIKCIGKGAFGEVFLTNIDGDKKLYATKRMDRAYSDRPDNFKRLKNEISILQHISHPNIIKIIEVKKTKSHYYIVTEYYNGGNLYDLLKKYKIKYGGTFPEPVVQYLMKQIVSAVYYLHTLKIIHRDIKSENILIDFPSKEDKANINMLSAQAKLIDFGFATQLHSSHNNITKTVLGTPQYMDPQLLQNLENHEPSKEGYNQKVDIWSLGVLCYEMIVGEMSFTGNNMNELFRQVKNGNYKLPLWLSKEAISFINSMLQYDPNKRLSAKELLKHPFLSKNYNEFHKVDKEQLKNKIKGNMIKINVMNNKTICKALSNNIDFNIGNNNKKIGIKRANTVNTVPENNQIKNLGIMQNFNIQTPKHNNDNKIHKIVANKDKNMNFTNVVKLDPNANNKIQINNAINNMPFPQKHIHHHNEPQFYNASTNNQMNKTFNKELNQQKHPPHLHQNNNINGQIFSIPQNNNKMMQFNSDFNLQNKQFQFSNMIINNNNNFV